MDKPISIIESELKEKINSAIIDSHLPMCYIELLIKDVYENIKQISNQIRKNEEEEYNKYLQSLEKDKITEGN